MTKDNINTKEYITVTFYNNINLCLYIWVESYEFKFYLKFQTSKKYTLPDQLSKAIYISNNIRLLTYQTDFVRPVLTPPLDSFFESLGRLHRAPVSSTEEAADGGVRQEAWHLCWQVTQEFPYLIYLYKYVHIDELELLKTISVFCKVRTNEFPAEVLTFTEKEMKILYFS